MITPSHDKTIDSEAPQSPVDYQGPTLSPSPTYSDIRVDAQPTANLPSSVDEVEWQINLKKLEKKIRKYNWSRKGDEAGIVASMRDLAASHSDPQVQAYWNRRADEFEKAPDSDKKALLMDIGRGVGILFAAPFAIVGAFLIGAGMILRASGNIISGGQVKKLSKY